MARGYSEDCDCVDCRDYRKEREHERQEVLAQMRHHPWCDSLVPSMLTNPCDCGGKK